MPSWSKLACSLFAGAAAHDLLEADYAGAIGVVNGVFNDKAHKNDDYYTRHLAWMSMYDMGLNASQDVPLGEGVVGSDGWGYENPSTGQKIAIYGTSCYVVFIDVTNPDHLVHLGNFRTACSNTHDVKVYKGVAVVVTDNRPGASGYENFEVGAQAVGLIQRFDMKQFPIVELSSLTSTDPERDTNACHNVVVNEDSGFVYLATHRPYAYAGADTWDLKVEPPKYIGRIGVGNIYRNFHDMHVLSPKVGQFAGKEIMVGASTGGGPMWSTCCDDGPGDTLSDNDAVHKEDGVVLWDVTDKSNVVELAFQSYQGVRFAHQVWATEDVHYAYLNDEGAYGFWLPGWSKIDPDGPSAASNNKYVTMGHAFDFSDLTDIKVQTFTANMKTNNHNMYIRDADHLMTWSIYEAGVAIMDISEPMAPKMIARSDPHPGGTSGWGGSWSHYPYFNTPSGEPMIVNFDRGWGVFVFKLEVCGSQRVAYEAYAASMNFDLKDYYVPSAAVCAKIEKEPPSSASVKTVCADGSDPLHNYNNTLDMTLLESGAGLGAAAALVAGYLAL